ncbi:hypothetical protein BAUCODRAFT_240427 [Baudoinia panamericana UAMH 10762]|uniref:FAD/NAD(P)-binding domain-containing protein n=1 Tax=Baudoinia panamericana (strain UAMH 10762) TaxID=717646 RepID=M2LH34_BAUPA|nr:uncharacterized protein BAUCODRAFT_240427 [Baudoinia panamericana UAMH 10762]EMC93437.1 hypothetical protein BAUCODRAFT_240427 [Baudoinia panamericana UAMH 10762]
MQRSLGQHRQATGEDGTGGADGPASSDVVHLELDALIVGAGFAGVYLLHRLRQEGFNVKIAEAGTGLGGIWHWNSYPGARVDSQYPVYAYGIPQVYETWAWSEQYPGEKELKRYFQHVDNVLDISKDVLFEHTVVAAGFDPSVRKWNIVCGNGTRFTARFFLACLGFAAKRYFPDRPGVDEYKGYICHSSFWPTGGVDVKGKRAAVVGTGATGIQIAQEMAREAEHLTCFVRTPNICIPMNQGPVDPEQAKKDLESLHGRLNADRYDNVAGFLYANPTKGVFDDPPDVREAVFEEAWRLGGFRILFSYTDLLTDQKANDKVYEFWAKKRRAQMKDPVKRDILAPEIQPHAFGGKRPSLEQDYYEQMDKPHITLVNAKQNPITHFVENGIVTEDGTLYEVDVVALATGFDSVTGGLKDLDLVGLNGERLADKWEMGTYTYLGMTTANFPNFLYTYGPQSPTAYANGPTIVEKQDEWIVTVLKKMREEGKTMINPTQNAEMEWKETINSLHKLSLRDKTEGWYMGTNIPGKPREALNYAGGIPLYTKTIFEVLDQDFKGFTVM